MPRRSGEMRFFLHIPHLPNGNGAAIKHLPIKVPLEWSFRPQHVISGKCRTECSRKPAQTVAASAPSRPRLANIANAVFQAPIPSL
jgi:hypothetical protein